jgi:IclR family mhp operon transcriptional activator
MIERKVKPVRALERGLDVLIEIRRCRAASLHDLHLRLALPKATLLRMLVTLAGRGLIWQRIADGAYLPSDRGDTALWLAEIASPHLAGLGRLVAWPSVLAVPRLDHVEVVETNSPLARLDSATLGPVGTKLSYIHTATGRACLAACSAGERDAILARIRPDGATQGSIAALNLILAEAASRGWASRDPPHPWPDRSRVEVVRDGRRSVAVPIRIAGQAAAAINITWPQRRTSLEDVVNRHLATLLATARAIGAEAEAAIGA